MHKIDVCAQIALLLELFCARLTFEVQDIFVAEKMVLQRARLIEAQATMVALVTFFGMRGVGLLMAGPIELLTELFRAETTLERFLICVNAQMNFQLWIRREQL